MTSIPRPLLGLVAASLLAGASVHSTPQKGGDKGVLAAVVDGAGTPFKDVALQDWTVREDGQARPIVSVRPATFPAEVVLIVDSTRATQNSMSDVRTGLLAFVRKLQAGGDANVAVMSVGGAAVTVADFGKAGADLDKVIQRLFPDESGSAVMLEAIAEAAKMLLKRPSPRRIILSLNLEGFPEASTMRTADVANAVLSSHAALWAVSFRNQASTSVSAVAGNDIQHGSSGAAGPNTGQNRDIILNNLTVQTGGARLTVNVPSAIETSLKQIADVLLAQYEVVYTRPEGPAPKQLQVAVSRPGAHVLVQRGPPQ